MRESGEMYLETILILSNQQNSVRSIDIAEYMNYSKPSISRAVNNLKNDGYIIIDERGNIALTKNGRDIAEKIYERHLVLSEMFESLGVSKETAVDDACKVEHVISDETFEAFKKHLNDSK
ncbi:MAG: metal-dependent transcriptional regulator [Firmicutes bacterium]|nr:metal-dependent transcriptional regulator [Bacillota bacterium]